MSKKEKDLIVRLGQKELNILNREVNYSAEQINDKMMVMLNGIEGKDNELIANAIKKVKNGAINAIEDGKDRGIVGNFLRRLKNSKDDFVARHTEIKTQLEVVKKMVNTKIEENNAIVPQIGELIEVFHHVEDDIDADLRTADQLEEYLQGELRKLDLQAKLQEDKTGGSIRLSTTRARITDDLDLLKTKKDELRTKKSYYASMALVAQSAESTARGTQQDLIAVRETVLPLWSANAVTTSINKKLAENINFSREMKKGLGEIFVANAEQASANAVAIAEFQRDGLLSVDSLQKMIKIMETAESKVEKSKQQRDAEFARREELNRQAIEKLHRIGNSTGNQIHQALRDESEHSFTSGGEADPFLLMKEKLEAEMASSQKS